MMRQPSLLLAALLLAACGPHRPASAPKPVPEVRLASVAAEEPEPEPLPEPLEEPPTVAEAKDVLAPEDLLVPEEPDGPLDLSGGVVGRSLSRPVTAARARRRGTHEPPRPKAPLRCDVPQGAKAAKIKNGTATVRVWVSSTGKVTRLKLEQDPGFGMGTEALRCVRAASFFPARGPGDQPVDDTVVLRVRYVLR